MQHEKSKWRLIFAAILLSLAAYVLASAFSKAIDLRAFRSAVLAHGVVAADDVEFVSLVFVCLEFAVAICAIAMMEWKPTTSRWSGIVLGGFFVGLSMYAAWLVAYPPPRPVGCGCGFSPSRIADWKFVTLQNSLCAVAAVSTGLLLRGAS